MLARDLFLSVFLFVAPGVLYSQTADSYTGYSASDDGSTIYAYAVTEGEMQGGGTCMHTYSIGLAFATSDYFPNFSQISTQAPASNYTSLRQDKTVVLDGTSTYYVRSVSSAFCQCIGRTFYQNVIDNPMRSIQAYYYCDLASTGFCALSGGFGTYHRCNQTTTTICNTLQSKPLNGNILPHFALKTVYQIQIGPFLGCNALQTADKIVQSCLSPDPRPYPK